MVCFFFFSSRRRHTRYWRDWSSDVCSSDLVLAALAVLSSWSIGGLFLSLGPELSALVYNSSSHLISGVGVFMLAGSAAIAQLLFGRVAPWRAAAIGSLALAIGMGLIVAAAAADSAVLFTAGAIVTGAGFLGGLRALSSV